MSKTRIEIVPTGNKFHVQVDGTQCVHKAGTQAAAQLTVDRFIKQIGAEKAVQVGLGTNTDSHVGEDGESVMNFNITERFMFLEHIVGMVAKGETNSAIIVGPGGLGKTHTVLETLNAAGLSDYDLAVARAEIGAAVPRDKTFKLIKGYSTGKHLYRQLYEGNDTILVFDDCDSIQKDANSLNILKSALDSYGRRVVSWGSEPINGSDLPTSFIFTGRIVFISNMPLNVWDGAVKSRCMTVDVHMTKAQILERMRGMLDNESFMPEYEMDHKLEALDIIDNCKEFIKELNLRTLIKATQARAAAQGTEDFRKQLVTYLLTN